MVKTIAHQELGGGYAMGPRYTVDTAEIEPGLFETMVIRHAGFDDDEMDVKRTTNQEQAKKDFDELLLKYAGPIQTAFLKAGMKHGGRYTIFRLNDFGYPVAQKIEFQSMTLTTYAQHWDAVELIYRPCRSRKVYKTWFYVGSFAICKGWQDLPENFGYEVLQSSSGVTISRSKYGCFDSRFFEDMKAVIKDVLTISEDYRVGVNGKVYA